MAVREFLQMTIEQAYKTPITSPVRGTDQIVCRLDEGNAFTMRPDPQVVTIQSGGGMAMPAYSVSDTIELRGALRVKLCYSQVRILMALGLINVDGVGAPWATSEPVGDLASVAIDHAIMYDDTRTYTKRRYLGIKCPSGSFEITRDGKVGTLTLQLQGSTPQGNHFDGSSDPDDTVFPVPDPSEYPTDVVLFSHSSQHLTLQSLFTKYESLTFNWTNSLDARYFADHFVSEMRSLGRVLTLNAMIKLDSTPNFRAYMEAVTPLAASLGFANGVNSFTMDFQGNGRISALDDDLANERIYNRNLTLTSQVDPATGRDFAFTLT